MLAGLLLAACQEKEENLTKEKLSLGKTEFVLTDGEANTVETAITAENVTPSVTVDAISSSWITAAIESGNLKITVTRNETGSERNGKLTVKGGKVDPITVTVKQPVYVAPAGTYEVGEVTPDGNGMVYWVDPADNHNAKAISLKKVTGDGTQWGLSTTELAGASSYVNGKSNTDILVAASGSENKYPAASWCAALGEGWYLPSLYELLQIFDIYNGVPHDSEQMTVAVPDNISPAEKAARADFEAKLQAAGATEKFNPAAGSETGASYWASTEEAEKYAWYVRVGSFAMSDVGVSKTSTSRHIRCVLALGNPAVPGEPVRMKLENGSVSLDGVAGSTTVAATIKNGSLSSVSVDAENQSWCTASIEGNNVNISVTENGTGAVRTATITVNATATAPDVAPVAANISVSQNPANVEKFKLRDTYSENGKVVGVIYWVSETGLSAKVVSLKRYDGKWINRDDDTNMTQIVATPNADDGTYNWNILKECSEKDEIPGVAFISAMGEGWYWPSSRELQELCAGYHGKESYAKCTDAYPNALPEDERNAQLAFEKVLSDNGGDPINSMADDKGGDSIYSSTEKSDTQVTYVRFGKKTVANSSKRSVRCVRAIKVINK